MSGDEARRGRPRSESLRNAVLTAAASQMVESGFNHLTVEGMAAEAGVAKQTVYRWWGSKVDVILEAIANGYLDIPLAPPLDTGDLAADIRAWLDTVWLAVEEGDTSRLVGAILTALASASETSIAIQAALFEPVRDGLHRRFELEADRHPGTLPASPQFLADTVGATVLFHLMLGNPKEPQWVDELVALVAPGA